MARYFFHLCDGTEVLLDPCGRELNGQSVNHAALAEARAIIAADVQTGKVHLDQHIEVHNEAGEIVHRILFEDAVTVTHLAVRDR